MTVSPPRADLSDRQQSALGALCEARDGIPSGWRWARTNTLDSLVELGLARRYWSGFGFRYTVTDEGRVAWDGRSPTRG